MSCIYMSIVYTDSHMEMERFNERYASIDMFKTPNTHWTDIIILTFIIIFFWYLNKHNIN